MKKFKDMSAVDFQQSKRRAEAVSFSPFAKFCMDTKGWRFKDVWMGKHLDKWEVFYRGHKNVDDLLNGRVKNVVAYQTKKR